MNPALISNLQSVLVGRKAAAAAGGGEEEASDPKPSEEEPQPPQAASSSETAEAAEAPGGSKPVVLVTNGDGIGSPGLASLVDALVRGGRCDVHACAPDSDKSCSGHSVTPNETLSVSSVEMNGATAFEVSGAIAGAREALMSGVPSLSVSLNWKKDESHESDFKDAVDVCLPLIHAAIEDIEKGVFPLGCMLNIEIPTSPSTSKGFKVTRQSLKRSSPSWQAVSANRIPSSGQFMSMHQSLGIQIAQLSRDASAAGAARRVNAQRKNVEVESVASAGKPETERATKKYFRMELIDKEQEDPDEDLDFRALELGFIGVTPLHLSLYSTPEIQASASDWLASALNRSDEAP